MTRRVTESIQRSGVVWAGGTMVGNEPALRVSISGWTTTDADVDRSVDAILARLLAVYGATDPFTAPAAGVTRRSEGSKVS